MLHRKNIQVIMFQSHRDKENIAILQRIILNYQHMKLLPPLWKLQNKAFTTHLNQNMLLQMQRRCFGNIHVIMKTAQRYKKLLHTKSNIGTKHV